MSSTRSRRRSRGADLVLRLEKGGFAYILKPEIVRASRLKIYGPQAR